MQLERVKKVAVIGAGSMGAGIAQVCSQAGYEVAMRDIEQRFVDGGFRRIRDPLMKRVEKGKMSKDDVDRVLANIRGTVSLKEAVSGAQFVIDRQHDPGAFQGVAGGALVQHQGDPVITEDIPGMQRQPRDQQDR